MPPARMPDGMNAAMAQPLKHHISINFHQLAVLYAGSVTWKWYRTPYTDTLLVGRDAEIAVMMPPAAFRLILNFVGLPDIMDSLKRMTGHIMGRLQLDEALYVPEHARKRTFLSPESG